MHDLAPLLIIGEVLLVNRLNGDELPGQLLHTKVDFTEGTAAKHLSSSVEISGCLRSFTCLVECDLNPL